MSAAPWQVLADCPHCRVEAAVVEWMDPLHPPCARGIPSERRCRACGFEERSDPDGVLVAVRDPEDLRSGEVARAALVRWASEDGEADPEVFCVANLGGPLEDVVGRLGRGEVVGTTFDVIAFLFPGAGAGAAPVEHPQLPRVVDGLATVAAARPVPDAPAEMDPRTPARFLVSVMVADGALRAGERTFVAQFLARNGLPEMAPFDLRVWRPAELGPPPPPELRDLLLEAAVHLMHLDRERDGSEWRVVRVFAQAWGVPDARLAAWDARYGRRYTGAMSRLGDLLTRLVR